MSAPKRNLAEDEDEARKKARVDPDVANSVTVYQPNVVIPDLSKKMNALVEVNLAR